MNYPQSIYKNWRPSAILLGLTLSTTASALSLTAMVDEALKRHPDRHLDAGRHSLADAMQRKADQPLASAPVFTLKHQTDAIGSRTGYREWESGVELPLWRPGQPDSYRREADRTRDEALAMELARRLEVAGEVRERLWQWELARAESALAESAQGIAHKLLKNIKRRVEAGELPRSDAVLAKREFLGREDDSAQASIRLEETRRLLVAFTGVETVEAATSESEPSNPELAPEHPALRLADAAVARARAERDRTKTDSGGTPSLWLGARSERSVSDADYDASVAVQISLPFGGGAHAGPDIARAEAALTEALAQRERIRVDLEERLTSAVLDRNRSHGARERSRQRQALADESLRLSRRAFELGETDLVRLLQAQEAAISAHHDAEICVIEHARAVARLNQAIGVVSP